MGRNHLPSSLTIPTMSNARQARVAIAQAGLEKDLADRLWSRVAVRKMLNQADALEDLGVEGAMVVRSFASQGESETLPTARELRRTDVVSRCMRELRKGIPTTGSICAFCMTERRYERVTYLAGGAVPRRTSWASGRWSTSDERRLAPIPQRLGRDGVVGERAARGRVVAPHQADGSDPHRGEGLGPERRQPGVRHREQGIQRVVAVCGGASHALLAEQRQVRSVGGGDVDPRPERRLPGQCGDKVALQRAKRGATWRAGGLSRAGTLWRAGTLRRAGGLSRAGVLLGMDAAPQDGAPALCERAHAPERQVERGVPPDCVEKCLAGLAFFSGAAWTEELERKVEVCGGGATCLA